MKMFMFMYARVMYPTLKKEVGVEIIRHIRRDDI